MPQESPKFTHDCDKCTFLGHYDGHDLYYCPQGRLPTVIARYGDDGPDYRSGMQFAASEPHLHEAFHRWVAKVMGNRKSIGIPQ